MEKEIEFDKIRKKINSIIDISAKDLDFLLSKIIRKNIPKGQRLIKQNEIADFICYVDKGLFRTYLTSDGKEINTEFFFEDSFMSAFTSFLSQKPTALNIEALEDSTLFCISKSLLEELYAINPVWLALGKHIFETEFVKKCKRESSFLQHNATERYLALLQQYPLIETSVSLSHIASYLGIQPETLSRIRAGKFNELTYIKDTFNV